MKSHVILKLKNPISSKIFPHWQYLIAQKKGQKTDIFPEIDALLSKYNTKTWITQEYKPAGKDWNRAELASGLNRIYRLILQRDGSISPKLIEEISSLPIVESVGIGEIRVLLQKLLKCIILLRVLCFFR